MTQPSATDHVYRCIYTSHQASPHHHSREANLRRGLAAWDTTEQWLLMTGALGSSPPSGVERYAAPDGTQYRFSRDAYTTELTDPSQITPEEPAMPINTVRPVTAGDPPTIDEVLEVTRRHPSGANLELGDRVVVRRITTGEGRPYVRCERVTSPNGTWSVMFDDLQHVVEVSQAVTPEAEDLYPLGPEKLRGRGSVIITSKPVGTLTSDTIQFGCQSWPMSALADAHGTMAFTPTGVQVTVEVPTAVPHGYLRIGDRDLRWDAVNEFAERITAGTAPPRAPHNAVVMEHGFYTCRNADHRHTLFLLPGERGETVMGAVDHTGSNGVVGQRRGLHGAGGLANCQPRSTPCTSNIMRLGRGWSLVPVPEDRMSWLREQGGWTFGTLPRDANITDCDRHGQVAS